jgi:hypothetical protein
MTQAITATGNKTGPTLIEFWKGYNMWNGVNNIGDSWAEIQKSTMNRSWRKLCPQFVTDFQDVEETPEQITKEVVDLERQRNLGMEETDVDELIASHSEESLSNEDLIELQQSNAPLKDAKSDEDVMVYPPPAKILGLKCLASIMQRADDLINMIEQEDPNAEKKSSKLRIGVEELACYRVLHKEKKKAAVRLRLDKFLSKAEKPSLL